MIQANIFLHIDLGRYGEENIRPVSARRSTNKRLIPEDGFIYAFPAGFSLPLFMATCGH